MTKTNYELIEAERARNDAQRALDEAKLSGDEEAISRCQDVFNQAFSKWDEIYAGLLKPHMP